MGGISNHPTPCETWGDNQRGGESRILYLWPYCSCHGDHVWSNLIGCHGYTLNENEAELGNENEAVLSNQKEAEL